MQVIERRASKWEDAATAATAAVPVPSYSDENTGEVYYYYDNMVWYSVWVLSFLYDNLASKVHVVRSILNAGYVFDMAWC